MVLPPDMELARPLWGGLFSSISHGTGQEPGLQKASNPLDNS